MLKFLTQIFTWWNGQTVGTRWFTARKGERVGEDELGNIYYRAANIPPLGERRWVIYNGVAEPSHIPPGWHGWIHHRTDTPPSKSDYKPRDWQKGWQPNQTGSAMAYRPKGSAATSTSRPSATGDYDAWSPEG